MASLDGSRSLPEKVPASIAVADAAVVCAGWHGVNALLTDKDCCRFIPALGWVSRWGGDHLMVMEDDENEIPVTIEERPAEPGHGVGLEDEGQDTQVGDGHDGAGQHSNQPREHHPIPADHVAHQPADKFKGSVQSLSPRSRSRRRQRRAAPSRRLLWPRVVPRNTQPRERLAWVLSLPARQVGSLEAETQG